MKEVFDFFIKYEDCKANRLEKINTIKQLTHLLTISTKKRQF